jgi:hypothetical protein
MPTKFNDNPPLVQILLDTHGPTEFYTTEHNETTAISLLVKPGK